MADRPVADTGVEPWNLPFDRNASADDILHCFRLLLGRRPDAAEWAGHAARAGERLREVVASYVNSQEFARRGLMTREQSLRLTASGGADIRLAARGDFQIFVDGNDAAVGQHVLAGDYEEHLANLLRHFLAPGMGVIDLGANIGVCALAAAALVGPEGYVLAVEPNPMNTRLLEASRRRNGFAQLVVCQAAAAASIGVLGLRALGSNGMALAIDEEDELLTTISTVAALRVDDLVAPTQRIDFLKIDVEGAEYQALQGTEKIIRRAAPVIFSEFSPALLASVSGIAGQDYLDWLANFGYRISVLGPDPIKPAGMNTAEIMAAYQARGVDHVDIICLPAGMTALPA